MMLGFAQPLAFAARFWHYTCLLAPLVVAVFCTELALRQKTWLRRMPVVLFGTFWSIIALMFLQDESMTPNCFLSLNGFVMFIAVLVALAVLSFRAAGELFASATTWQLWLLLSLATALNIFQYNDLQCRMVPHAVLRWGATEYLQRMGTNMLFVFLPSVILLLLLAPWRLVPKFGLARMLTVGLTWLLFQYLLTAMLFIRFTSFGVE